MVFSDTTALDGLIQACELYSGLGDTGISGNTNRLKHFTRLLNDAYYRTVAVILDSQNDWQFDDYSITGTAPICTRAFVAGQRDYSFNAASWSLIAREAGSAGANAAIRPLRIERVDITYDGTNYYRAYPLDSGELDFGLGNDTTTDGYFTKNQPAYDVRNNSLWIYPLASASDVTSGAKIRLTFYRNPTAFVSTDTTATPGIDLQFHPMLAVDASYRWAAAKGVDSAERLAGMLADYEAKLRTWTGTKNEDRELVLKQAYTLYD